ncbi:MAG: transposase [Planctomycetes bacterium]|nr:transposase [Planctomycetota bacterium]MBL7044971.1 transposase [Pirellulaceae bacterium]
MAIENFNLPAPPGFRGLHPDLPIRTYRRHLPHWRQSGATYFVTFRLADSIPQQHLRALKRWRETWERSHPEPRSDKEWEAFAREITSRTEAWLDEGYGECVFRHRACSDEMSNSLLHFQGERYTVFCFTVMPNHVHLVMKPADGLELEKILDSAKGFVSRKVNAHLGRKGKLWEQESFDRIVRDEEHLFRVIQYIGRNPAKAHLPRDQWVRWIHPDWEKSGWRFHENA